MDGPVNEPINPPELPAPVGFSHAVRAGDTVYCRTVRVTVK